MNSLDIRREQFEKAANSPLNIGPPNLEHAVANGYMNLIDTIPYLRGTYGTQVTASSGATNMVERVKLNYETVVENVEDTTKEISDALNNVGQLTQYLPIAIGGLLLVAIISIFKK